MHLLNGYKLLPINYWVLAEIHVCWIFHALDSSFIMLSLV